MNVRYKLTPAAEKDLEKIWRYSAENWGVQQAHHYLDEMLVIFDLIAENPKMGWQYQELTPAVRLHIYKSHLIVYLPTEDGIDIVRLLHQSMDIDSQLENS